jgi:hypothetical protein
MRKKLTIIAGAGVALVASGGAALAATTPEGAESGLRRASEVTGIELPASHGSHPTADDHPGGAPEAETLEVEVPEVEVPVVEVPDVGAPPADTHGATVSTAAQDASTTGAAHGAAVSTAARENGAAHAADPETREAPEQAATPGTVPEQASDAGAEGAAHAADRGRP